MNVVFYPDARQELFDAIQFYEQQLPGLGILFFKEISDAINLIRLYPEAHQLITTRTRKCPLRKFPYLVLYGIIDDTIVVSAVAHQHRHPNSYIR